MIVTLFKQNHYSINIFIFIKLIFDYLKILDRYILKRYLGSFFFIVLLFSMLSVVVDAAEKIEDFNRHIGVYAFTRNALIDFSKLERSKLEIIESLEGIRIIENSKKIRMISTSFHGLSIDTPEDLIKAKKFNLSND